MESLTFRTSMLVVIVGNMLYLIIVYYLWKAIYASNPSEIVNGMSFYDTIIYLVLASALFSFMECYIVWNIGNNFETGNIMMQMLKPMDYQMFMFFSCLGEYAVSFVTTFLPTFFIVYLLTDGRILVGYNILCFIVSVFMGILVNFNIDFLVGIICFYTHSIWGVNVMKEVVVGMLGGAVIPLAFFPEAFRNVVNFLPFQTIYNTPMQILISKTMDTYDYFSALGNQFFWVVTMFLISRIFWDISKRKITINGG